MSDEPATPRRASELVARYKFARLRMGPGTPEVRATEALPKNKLRAKNDGTLESATISAGYFAQKTGKTMYIYVGNSFGHVVWRVSYKASDYLSPINNTGDRLYSVTPDLKVFRHEVTRDDRVARIVARFKEAVIRKEKGEFCVRSPDNPDWSGGCYPSEGEAEKRLEQVEWFKNKAAGTVATHVVEVYTTGQGAESVQKILEKIDALGAPGHSFGIKGDQGENLGGWDGDGGDHIKEIKVREL
jgi:hypothetical protein